MHQNKPDTRDRCPKGHISHENSKKTMVVTSCGCCGEKIVFLTADWECPHCGDTEHLAGGNGNEPFYVVEYCRYCERYYIITWRSDINGKVSIFMSDAEERQFFELLESELYEKAVDHILGVISMYALQMNFKIMADDPELEVEDVVENF